MTFKYFNTKLHHDRWKQKQPFTFWYCDDNFYLWKDIVGKKVSKLRSIAELRAFSVSLPGGLWGRHWWSCKHLHRRLRPYTGQMEAVKNPSNLETADMTVSVTSKIRNSYMRKTFLVFIIIHFFISECFSAWYLAVWRLYCKKIKHVCFNQDYF